MKSSIIASAVIAAGLCASASAAEVTLGVDFASAYVATGATCNDGWVFTPWADIGGLKVGDTALPLTFGVWANYDIEDDYSAGYDKWHTSEIDFSVTFDLGALWTPCEDFSWSIGYLEYDYPNGGDANNLIDYRMGYNCFLSPSFRAKYRLDTATEGKCEFQVKIGHDFGLTDDLSLSLSADCWYVHQSKNEETRDDGFACADFSASLNYKAFYAAVTYIAQIDDDVLPDSEGPEGFGYDVDWVFSVGTSYTF